MDTVGVSDSLLLVSDVVASADSLVDVAVLPGDEVALVSALGSSASDDGVDVADDSADSLAVVAVDEGDSLAVVRLGRRRSGGARRGRDGSLRGRRHVRLAGLSRRDSGHRRSDRGRRCFHRCLRLDRRGRLRLAPGSEALASQPAPAPRQGPAGPPPQAREPTLPAPERPRWWSPLSSPGWAMSRGHSAGQRGQRNHDARSPERQRRLASSKTRGVHPRLSTPSVLERHCGPQLCQGCHPRRLPGTEAVAAPVSEGSSLGRPRCYTQTEEADDVESGHSNRRGLSAPH